MLSHVIPQCSYLIAPLEEKIGRLKSTDKIVWSSTQLDHLKAAQKALESRKSVGLPKCSDQLWIVTVGSSTKHGIGATLYVHCEEILMFAGFFRTSETTSIVATVRNGSTFNCRECQAFQRLYYTVAAASKRFNRQQVVRTRL